MSNTFTEEEFKKVLRTLFTEKKRVKELQKQLGQNGFQKNQANLSDFHKYSLTEEYAKLKTAYFEKEKECEIYQKQLEKVKPAFKKLVQDLKIALSDKEAMMIKQREESERIKELAKESEQLEQKLAAAMNDLNESHQQNQDLKKRIENHQPDSESEKEEILAKCYSKLKDLLKRRNEILDEKDELIAKLEERQKRFSKSEKEYADFKATFLGLKRLYEEKNSEVKKAHHHLAKKVKETAVLSNESERLKMQIMELENLLQKQNRELNEMQNNKHLSKLHEEQSQSILLEKTEVAKALVKEWQDKYLSLQEDWEKKKAELLELQKRVKNYDQMAAAFSNLKSMLGPFENNEN